MFIKDVINNNGLVFIKSNNIKAFPCGRRRAIVDSDNNNNTVSDKYYIPFDPEARLNTEANNRKHSGLNGFKQSYLMDTSFIAGGKSSISMVIAGYLFNIEIDSSTSTIDSVADFGTAIAAALELEHNEPSSIFANIKLANMKFFDGATDVPAATTEILRDQTTNEAPLVCLDILYDPNEDKEDPDNYYFYGLSFSKDNLENKEPNNSWVSLQLLDYKNGTWVSHEASNLPKIEHGDEKDSVIIPGNLTVNNNLYVKNNITADGDIIAETVMVKDGEGNNAYATTLKVVNKQLQFWTRPKQQEQK